VRLTNQTQRIEALRRVPLLAGLSRAKLGELAHRAEEVNVPKGAYLTREGVSGAEVYVVLDGSFVIRQGSQKKDTLKTGQVFGEMSLIDGLPRTANVVAERACVVLAVHRKDFSQLLDSPRITQGIMRSLAQRLRESDSKVRG